MYVSECVLSLMRCQTIVRPGPSAHRCELSVRLAMTVYIYTYIHLCVRCEPSNNCSQAHLRIPKGYIGGVGHNLCMCLNVY